MTILIRQLIIVLATLLIFVTQVAASTRLNNSSQEKSEYYRHLMFRETPFAPYRGIHPINKEQAEKIAHYRFDYDKRGRLNAITHLIGDTIIGDNGNWDTFIWFAPKVTIAYNENQEIHQYFDVDNQQIEAHGKVYKAKYKLKNGERTALSFYDAAGKPSENAWHAHKYHWSRDNEGRVIEKRFNLKEEQVSIRPYFDFYEVRLQYDDKGQLAFMYNYGLDGKPTNNKSGAAIDRIYYDRAGNFQRWQVFDKDKNPVEGNRPMVHVGEHLYDNVGNKIGIRGFNRFGQRMVFSWGDFETVSQYDSFGNSISTVSLDENGKFKTKAQIIFSQDGTQRSLLQFVDAENKPVSSPNLGGASAIKYKYEKGSRAIKGMTKLDENMSPISASN